MSKKKMKLEEFRVYKRMTNAELAEFLGEKAPIVHMWCKGTIVNGERYFPTPRKEAMLKIKEKTKGLVDISAWY